MFPSVQDSHVKNCFRLWSSPRANRWRTNSICFMPALAGLDTQLFVCTMCTWSVTTDWRLADQGLGETDGRKHTEDDRGYPGRQDLGHFARQGPSAQAAVVRVRTP